MNSRANTHVTTIFFLMTPRPPSPTLFPYTTLFRSNFPDIGSAVNTVIRVIQSGIPVARIELLDEVQIDEQLDRKSTRLNSSHVSISYAVFCLKKKRWQKARTSGTATSTLTTW